MNNGKYNVTLIHQVKQQVKDQTKLTFLFTRCYMLYHRPVQDRKAKRTGRDENSASGNMAPHERKKMKIASSRLQNGNHACPSTPPTPPKILTARKRTKNGILKAPTELWLV